MTRDEIEAKAARDQAALDMLEHVITTVAESEVARLDAEIAREEAREREE